MNQDTTPFPLRPPLPVMLSLGVAWGAAAAAWPWAPTRVPVHWNWRGEADRYMNRTPGLVFSPAMLTLVAAMLQIAPRIDPVRRNAAGFERAFRTMQTSTILFLTILHLVNLARTVGRTVEATRTQTLVAGLMFVSLGNTMGKVRPNAFVGVRTPWTLLSADVWTRTHRFTGRLMVVAGIGMLLAGLLLPRRLMEMVVASAGAGLAVVAVFYSYWISRQLGDNDQTSGMEPV